MDVLRLGSALIADSGDFGIETFIHIHISKFRFQATAHASDLVDLLTMVDTRIESLKILSFPPFEKQSGRHPREYLPP